MTEVQPGLDRTLSRRFAAPAEDARATRTAAALEANGITVLRAPDRADPDDPDTQRGFRHG